MENELYQKNLERLKKGIIYGTQYYRIVPLPEEWDSDLKKIRSLGMNTIKIWAQWPRIEREKGVYDWSELQRLMEVAHHNKIKVIINLILYHVPAWSFEKNGAVLVPLNRVQTRFSHKRYLGGYYACWDNQGVRNDAGDFIRNFVEHFSKCENLLAWDIWNEPDKPECACGHSASAYRAWLKKRGFKTVAEFNAYTGECYAGFDDITPPCDLDLLSQVLLYSQFRFDSLSELIRWGYRCVRDIDRVHPIMTHSHSGTTTIPNIPFPGDLFPMCWDDWGLASSVDLYGGSTHEIRSSFSRYKDAKRYCPLVVNLETKRAATKGYFWTPEISIGYWTAPGFRQKMEYEDVLLQLFTFLAHGSRGFLFWQYKPERILGDESPMLAGMVAQDGEDTPNSEAVKQFAGWIRENQRLLTGSRTPDAENAVLFSLESSVVATLLNHVSYADAFAGANYLLWRNNVPYDIVRYPSEIRPGHKRIYVPLGILIAPEMVMTLKEFVEQGGTLIVEPGFTRYDRNGWVSAVVPSGGLSEIFGYQEKEFFYGPEFPITVPGGTVRGIEERVRIDFKSGQTLGRFSDGEPAIQAFGFGKGKIIYFASHVSAAAFQGNMTGLEQKLVLKTCGFRPFCDLISGQEIIVKRLESAEEDTLFIFNYSGSKAAAGIRFSRPFIVKRILRGDRNDITSSQENNVIKVNMLPNSVLVIAGKINKNSER